MVALVYFYGGLSTVFKYCCPFGVTSALFTSGSLKWHTSGLDFRLFLRRWCFRSCVAGGLPGNAALTLLRCRRRRARPDLGDSAAQRRHCCRGQLANAAIAVVLRDGAKG